MLIEFSVENFLSFHERVTLSFVAAPEFDEDESLRANTFEAAPGLRLLKTMLVFGPNASGKSNLVKAAVFLRNLVLHSAKETQAGEPIDVTPFRLDATASKKPSSFEIKWADGERIYRYALTVDAARVVAETLTRATIGSDAEASLFTRKATDIRVGEDFPEGKDLVSKTRDNALFLSVVAQFNGEEAQRIVQWFRANLRPASGLRDTGMLARTHEKLSANESRPEILRLIREADLGISNVTAREVVPDETELKTFPEELRQILRKSAHLEVRVHHDIVDEAGHVVDDVSFDLDSESDGTQKFVALAGPLVDVVETSAALFLDELDARLHPRLTRAIVRLFQGEANAGTAQLLATTHDTNLLDHRFVRQDQIWFTEKDARGATKLYSLAEFDVPEKVKLERDYLLGKYGAVPAVGELGKPGAAT